MELGGEKGRVERKMKETGREELCTTCSKIRPARVKRCSSEPALLYDQGW